jgi:chromosome partitioning protein
MVISIVNHKGGTGKTTTTVNLGSALAALGKKVLLVDFDAQGSLSYSLGIDESSPTIAEALLGETNVQQVLIDREGLQVLPARESLADVELSLARAEERFGHLKALLVPLSVYDFTLIDCPPSLTLLTINALVASNHVIVPMQMDVLALRGLDSLINIVKQIEPLNQHLTMLGILPVMVEPRKNIYKEIVSHIKVNYTIPLFKQTIRTCVKAAEAPSFGKSVVNYAPDCNTARDYKAFANEFLLTFQQNTTTTI